MTSVSVPVAPREKINPFDDQELLPRDWELGVDSQNRVYFKYAPTRQTTWQDPRFLPQNWEQRIDDSGRLHFAYTPSQATTWSDPRGTPAGWSVILTTGSTQLVFVESKSGFSTTVDPRGLPPGTHMSVNDASGKVYFRHDADQTTSWDDPRTSMDQAQLQALRQSQWDEWFIAQIKDSYARYSEENNFVEVGLVSELGIWDRFWQSMHVRISLKSDENLDLNQMTDSTKDQNMVCCGCVRAQTVELITVYALLLLELFQIVMACMLSFLVPTLCTVNTVLPPPGPPTLSYTCTTADYYNPQPGLKNASFATFVLAVNFATLFVAIVHYHWSWKREKAFVQVTEHLPVVAADQLPKVLKFYPLIDNLLYLHNYRMRFSTIVFAFFFVANLIVSAILVFGFRWAGTTTATVFLTNVGLMLQVIRKSYSQSSTGLETKEALSLFDYRPLSFNVIDLDYVDPRDATKGGRVEVINPADGRPHVPDYRKLPYPVELRQNIAQRHATRGGEVFFAPPSM